MLELCERVITNTLYINMLNSMGITHMCGIMNTLVRQVEVEFSRKNNSPNIQCRKCKVKAVNIKVSITV